MKTPKTPRSLLSCKRTARQILTMTLTLALFAAYMVSPAYATRIQDTTWYKGGMDLLQDLMTIVTFAAPLIGGIAAVVFLIRRGMADETEKKKWDKMIFGAICTGVGAGLITGLITVLISYFNPTTP